MFQEVIVYIILAVTAAAIIRYVYRQATGKRSGCSCDSCPKRGGKCHCQEEKDRCACTAEKFFAFHFSHFT